LPSKRGKGEQKKQNEKPGTPPLSATEVGSEKKVSGVNGRKGGNLPLTRSLSSMGGGSRCTPSRKGGKGSKGGNLGVRKQFRLGEVVLGKNQNVPKIL